MEKKTMSELLPEALQILDSGQHFRLGWFCSKCKEMCLANVPNTLFTEGARHEDCGGLTKSTEKAFFLEKGQKPVVIPSYEDMPDWLLREIFGSVSGGEEQ